MLFNSYFYLLVFLPLALLGFSFVSRWSARAGFAWLVMVSLLFYAWWNPEPDQPWSLGPLLILMGSCGGNYVLGKLVAARQGNRAGRWLLTAGVTANLLLLGYYKYTAFLLGVARDVTGWSGQIPHIVLPLAISFFTFLQIAYLVDAFRGRTAEHGFMDYLLFVTFFPHLIAGPLVHHSEMIPQFKRARPSVLRHQDLVVGFTLLVLGLFKKVVLADNLAAFANPLFALAEARPLTIGEGWVAILSYTLQLYFDFSGYSDMAIGSARLFGIRFPVNFNSPYKATSVVDFWRRWHMTLSRFLRDYLYFALGGNRKGRARWYLNLLLTMTIGGIWHGAGLTFLLWGFAHGLLLCLNHAWSAFRKRFGIQPLPRPLAIGLTFLVVALAWVWFRAPNFSAALAIYQAAVGMGDTSWWPASSTEVVKAGRVWLPLLAGLAIVWFMPNTQQFLGRYRPALRVDSVRSLSGPRKIWEWRPTLGFGLATLLLLYATARDFDKISEFIYFQF